MPGTVKNEVVIVGGGAIGACCALELARRGARVTLLERGPELASGFSSGNAGLICPSHSTPISNRTATRRLADHPTGAGGQLSRLLKRAGAARFSGFRLRGTGHNYPEGQADE